MSRRISKGQCHLCGDTFGKRAMTKHIEVCKQKQANSEMSSPGRSTRKTNVYHLLVEGRYLPDYWMHLDVPADATLEDLDIFLRNTWLECCGHMSAFEIEGKMYSVAPMADFDDKTMDFKLDEVLSLGMEFYHEYDFGSTTHLKLKVISQEQEQIKGKSVTVLARNEPPTFVCVSCGEMATHLCTECICSDEGLLCERCAAEHKCGEEMLLPIVNSPRVGVCGYTGQ